MTRENPAEPTRAALLATIDPSVDAKFVIHTQFVMDEEDFERYRSAYKAVFDIVEATFFVYVREACRGLFAAWEESNQRFLNGEMSALGSADVKIQVGTQLRTATLSACASLVYHQERTYDLISERFGAESSQMSEAKSLFGELYDECFGYRYLYKLRNVMVHESMLAAALKWQAMNSPIGPIALTEINMDRALLIESKKVGAKLREELASLPGDPSVLQMLGEAVPALRDVNEKLLRIIEPNLQSECEAIVEFDRRYEGAMGVRGLISGQSVELRAPFTTNMTPWADSIISSAYRVAGVQRTDPDETPGG